jgi:hypothetical protein
MKEAIKYAITVSICVMLILAARPSVAAEKCDNDKPLPPILSKTFASDLRLMGHFGHKTPPLSFNKQDKKLFKTKNMTVVHEDWNIGRKTISIDRYYFDCKEDALRYPRYTEFSNNWSFPGWPETADVGDASCWETQFSLIFVKGKVLTSIVVTPLNLDEETKNFTLSVARFIAKKL